MRANIEKAYLGIFFVVFLWVSVGTLWDHNIKHDFPYSYLASDTFQHQVRAESIKEMGNYRYEAPYIVTGYTDNIGFYPPIMYHLGVILSYASGLETHDSTYLLVFLLSFGAAVIMYLIIRRFNRNIAIISLPISLLIFSKAPYIGFTWGNWPSLMGQFFLIFFFWSLSRINLKNSFMLIGLALSSIVLTHTAEVFFAVIFLAVLTGYKWLARDTNKRYVFTIMKSMVLFLIVAAYYLIIFYFTWSKIQGFNFSVLKDWGNSPIFTLTSFGVFALFLLLGVLFSLFVRKKNMIFIVLIGIVSIFFGFGNYFGFGIRAFQVRMFWPIYLSFLIGLGIYQTLKLVIQRWNMIYSLIISIVLLIVLNLSTSSAFIPTVMSFTSPGIMNPYHWDMFKFLQEQEDGRLLFLYGDIYGQNAVLRNAHMAPYMVNSQDYLDAIQNKTVKRSYKISLLGDHHGVLYAYRKSLFSYGYHAKEEPQDYYNKVRDICSFRYYVIDLYTQQPAIAQYNQIIRGILLKNDFISEIFRNQVTSVLLNDKPGGECLPEEGIKLE